MKSLFRCPVCGGPLDREERVYRCADRHSYDIAKEGYTYLLPPNQKHSADPGDDKAMSAARRDFLSKKYYAPLLNTLCSRILPLVGEHPVILDAGCGEGYYTAGIRAALTAAGKTPAIAGIDISKSILRLAAKREKQVEFAVASCYHLPFADETADLLLDCFSPLAIDEFRRVLKVVSRTNQSHFGSDLCFLPPFARRIFRCFRPALPDPILFWVKTGSDTVRPHPLQQRLVVHRAGGDSKTDLDDLIISAVQPNTVDLQSRIDLRLSEKVRAENCSDFSHIVQSCG